MAGSWGHITDDDGSLLPPGKILDMLDTGGDVCEAFEECYGMVQWLARPAGRSDGGCPAGLDRAGQGELPGGLEIGRQR